jgi:hypothetical protein
VGGSSTEPGPGSGATSSPRSISGATSGLGPGAGAEAAASYLCELLLRPGRYRRRWEQYAERTRSGRLNQLAIAEVLAHYLWEHPRSTGDADVLPRQLKDTTSRALSGRLSKAALALFMDAFDLPDFERDQLLKLWDGSASVRILSGAAGIRDDKAAQLGQPSYRTLSMHDHHYLGPDGFPARHRTIQVIEALADGVDRIPYRADTTAVSVEIGQGCSGLSGPFRSLTEGLFGTDILIAKRLAAGETATLEYVTIFRYETQPVPEFRRTVVRSLQNLDIRVQFDAARLPREIVRAVWDGLDGPEIASERVIPDSQLAVHLYLRLVEKTVVGFRWTW